MSWQALVGENDAKQRENIVQLKRVIDHVGITSDGLFSLLEKDVFNRDFPSLVHLINTAICLWVV